MLNSNDVLLAQALRSRANMLTCYAQDLTTALIASSYARDGLGLGTHSAQLLDASLEQLHSSCRLVIAEMDSCSRELHRCAQQLELNVPLAPSNTGILAAQAPE